MVVKHGQLLRSDLSHVVQVAKLAYAACFVHAACVFITLAITHLTLCAVQGQQAACLSNWSNTRHPKGQTACEHSSAAKFFFLCPSELRSESCSISA